MGSLLECNEPCFMSIFSYVRIAMEAMDQILLTCRAQSLNLFVESFLKTVQQLLESQDPYMQLLATQSVSIQRIFISFHHTFQSEKIFPITLKFNPFDQLFRFSLLNLPI